MVPKKVWILTGQIPLDFRALDSSLAQCYVHPVSLWMQWQFCQPLNCLWGCLPFLSRIIHVCIQIALLVCPRSLIEVVVLVAQSNPTLWPHGLSEGLPFSSSSFLFIPRWIFSETLLASYGIYKGPGHQTRGSSTDYSWIISSPLLAS